MGLLSILGKVGAIAGAPFTGGASLAAIPAIDALGAGAGAAAGSMANNRGAKTAATLDARQQLENQLLARQLEQRRARNDAYNDVMRGQLATSYQLSSRPDGAAGRLGAGGGVVPTDAARMAGGEITSQGLRRLLQPDLVNPTGMPTLDQSQQMATNGLQLNPGLLEKILGIVGAGASAYGAASKPSPVARS